MDVETSVAIESLGAATAKLRLELRTEMVDLRVGLRAEMADLRVDLRDGLADNRRHTQVLFEALRDDIRILAEGLASVSSKLDSLQR